MSYDKMTNAESIVADFLKANKIWWEFERPVVLKDDFDRVRIWSPDYYLPELGIYIEVAASGNEDSYKYRHSVYEKNKIPIIFVNPYKQKDWQAWLISCMNDIHNHRWALIKSVRAASAEPKSSYSYRR